MSEWKEYKFSDFVNINPTVKLKQGERYSFVEMKDLSDGQRYCSPSVERQLSGGARFHEGDTLFARITPCLENGKICQAKGLKNGVGFGSTEFFVFRGKERISDNDFVFYLSRWDEVRAFAEMNFDGTSGRQRVPKDAFNNLFLTLPPLPEQKSIASVLSSLDDKIDLLHRQNKTLEALAETLFRQWFVRRPEFAEGEEEGWEIGKLGDYADVTTGKGLRRHEFDDNGIYPVLGANGEIGRTNNYLTDERLILTGRVGTLGKVYISEDKVWISDNVLIVKPESIFFYPIYFVLRRTEFENLNVGSTQPLVTQTDLKNIEFKLPSADILKSYEAQCATYFEKISKNITQIRTLTSLRDVLLPNLMSGEVRVKGWQLKRRVE